MSYKATGRPKKPRTIVGAERKWRMTPKIAQRARRGLKLNEYEKKLIEPQPPEAA